MNTTKKHFKIIILMLFTCVTTLRLSAQNDTLGTALGSSSAFSNTKNWVSKEPFEPKVFIKNKGQFNGKNNLPSSNIEFGVEGHGFQIYFTPTGLTYRIDKWGVPEETIKKWLNKENGLIKKSEKENSDLKVNVKNPLLLDSSIIQLEWKGANANVQIIPQETVDEYFIYGANVEGEIRQVKANGHKKILYKNLYPQIDVEYFFHEKYGIKYNLILHPGADINNIKMHYESANKISLDEKGNVHFATPFGDIIEYAPISFYKEGKEMITSSFKLQNNTLTFKLKNYDATETVVVDPWVVDPLFSLYSNSGDFSLNKVWDVASDPQGNVYAFGGGAVDWGPHLLRKYDSNGTLLWTVNLLNIVWYYGTWHGDLAVDDWGNCYISQTVSDGRISKFDTNGNLMYSRSNLMPTGKTGEFFALSFNTLKTQLITTTHPNSRFLTSLNPINGDTLNFSSVVNPLLNETRALTSSPNGNFYGLSCAGGPSPSMVYEITPALAQGWATNTGYTAADILYNGPNYTGLLLCDWCFPPANTFMNPNPQNGIAASMCYVYTYEGKNLKKWDISNGNLISSVAVPSGKASYCSGIIVDSCDFVYVGTTQNIRKYNPALNLVATFPTPDTVYCLSFGKTMNTILASGKAFVTSIDNTPNSTVTIPFALTKNSIPATCQCVGSASVTPVYCSYPEVTFTYLWNNGQTASTATGLCSGTYSVTVTASSKCGTGTQTATVTVTSTACTGITASINSATMCSGNTSCPTLTATGGNGTSPYTYSWSTGATTQNISPCPLATTTYTVKVTDKTGASATTTATVTVYPAVTVSTTIGIISCNGGKSQVTATGGGGTSPFTFNWSTGATTTGASSTIPNLAANTYSVVVTDSKGCTATTSVTLTDPPPLLGQFTKGTAACSNCGCQEWILATSTGGTPPYTYLWPDGYSNRYKNKVCAGNYTIKVTDKNGCSVDVNVTSP